MLDTVTYPDPQVSQYIAEHFIAYEASMADKAAWQLFRTNHILWTPSVGCADRNGSMHYVNVGYMPPSDFLSALKIGRARCLMAWIQHAEAARVLEEAATVDNSMTAEALFWLSTAYYFQHRDSAPMYEVWQQLVSRYPDSPWAHRTYPRPDFNY